MTLIFGAKCIDGVVLVADRMVTVGESSPTYIAKIRMGGNIPWAIFGAAGIGTLFEEFLTNLPRNVGFHLHWINHQNAKSIREAETTFGKIEESAQTPVLLTYTFEDFKHNCVDLITEMKKRYSVAFENENNWCNLQILIGMNEGTEAKLYYLESENCIPAEVPEALFIGQAELAEIFRKCWNKSLNMKQSAKIGALAIKYVEQEEISKSVGVGKNQPQIWYIPDGEQPKEVIGTELQALMQDVDNELRSLRIKLHSLFRS